MVVVNPAPMQAKQEPRTTPAALGYRPVGEWEHNAACWSAWPAHEYAWGQHLAQAQREFVAFCHALLAREGAERLELLVPDAAVEADARAALSALGERVRYRRLPYGDVWLRDTAPLFVRGAQGLASVRFRFNGWGEKYDYPGDTELGARVAEARGVPAFAFEGAILEGGALELDGAGTCLTTESCLLNENRGSGLTRARLEGVLRDALAVDKVLWLRDGLLGDHTDGHIDNLVRFAAPGVVLHMRPAGADDPNGATFEAIERDLSGFVDARGERLRLLPLASPGRVLGIDGTPMAASYMNFYVGNRALVVPAFDSEHDEPARRAIAAAFPGRDVVLCRARATLDGGGGTFHCMTRQEPAVAP
jgi:agmatine deiminase